MIILFWFVVDADGDTKMDTNESVVVETTSNNNGKGTHCSLQDVLKLT